ncbi:MAG: acyl-CoA thioesterase [Actinomycetota bacterium]|nr:acyl-CoA thioesterase [Actinomycetota bacterium]
MIQLGRPTDRKPPFKFSAFVRVGFSDTDAQGIVYYGRYLPYFDTARVEYLRHLGLLKLETGIDDPHEFVMRASSVEYFAPARFDDLIEIFVRMARIGRTSATFECVAHRRGDTSAAPSSASRAEPATRLRSLTAPPTDSAPVEGEDLLMVTATQTLVLVDLDERKAVPIPDEYRERVRAFEGADLE